MLKKFVGPAGYVSALLFLTACTTSTVLTEAASSGTVKNRGVYGVAAYGDEDPVKIKGRQPGVFDVHGVDVSRHNRAINWSELKKAGIKFAFIKATEGKDDRDPDFRKHWAGAARAGIHRSAYHFYYFCASPEDQARNYIRAAPRNERSLPPVLDVEWNPKSPTCKIRPPREKVVASLKRWLDIVEKHYGQKPIIYTTVDFHEDNLSRGELPGYHYWLRSVTAEPKYKYPGRPWVFWQYTGTGLISGATGPIDINVFYGSDAKWRSFVATQGR